MKKKKNVTSKMKNPYWKNYYLLKKKIETASKVLANDFTKKSKSIEKIKKDSNMLMLLLGECNYFTIECKHCKKKGKWG